MDVILLIAFAIKWMWTGYRIYLYNDAFKKQPY